MAADANSGRITGKVQGRDIVLTGPVSKEEIRNKVWWWRAPDPRTAEEREDGSHEFDPSEKSVINTLGGYYEVPDDPGTHEADELVQTVYTELNPDR
ncbi:hypothetical protein [Streptomyces sennicomposti]|uniref:hypothetical protein n=1 Tax=Streptomyces sennicomposti TaxID=2873384 RepID=UPI001CA60485|nr:hypothetical protein [Streptomyces sennicomposti]MBY8864439.1 hypothetical protein [Streptomyces sennicomposti]